MREAIILAGGFGTRLRSVVADRPKPMALISDRPFLDILLRFIAKNKFERVILSLGFMAEKIIAHFGNRFSGMELVYVIEDVPLGTGGGARLAMSSCHEDHVFVFNGDTFLDLEIDELERQWESHHQPVIVGREVPDTARYGRIQAAAGHVSGFIEKGVSGPGIINAGCYLFNKGQLDQFALKTPFSLESDYLSKTVSELPFGLFVSSGKFLDIGEPQDFLRAQTELAIY